jgi:hypothetical protein
LADLFRAVPAPLHIPTHHLNTPCGDWRDGKTEEGGGGRREEEGPGGRKRDQEEEEGLERIDE